MGTMGQKLREWQHVVLALGSGALVVLGLAVIPTATLDHVATKIGSLLGVIVADPAGALGAVTALAGFVGAAIVVVRRAWHAEPPREIRPRRVPAPHVSPPATRSDEQPPGNGAFR